MIFEPKALCTPVYCLELSHETLRTEGTQLPDAPFCAVLVSSGRVALTANSAPQLLGAGELFLARGREVDLLADAGVLGGAPALTVVADVVATAVRTAGARAIGAVSAPAAALALAPATAAADAPATITVTPADDCHLLAVGIGGVAAQHAAQGLRAPLVSSTAACPMAAQLLTELRDAVESKLSAAQQSECAYRALCALADADATVPTLPPLVADAVLAIRQSYAGLYGVEELSAQLGVSKSHLVRLFSAAMGVPPGQYLTGVRVAAAKQLLAQRDYGLEVVASLCGFSGANYFCKVFKKETGISPARYRTLHAGAGVTHALLHEENEWEKALYI